MATGAGKTRTVIALCDLLLRCNWAKRILFLADRVALVNQAVKAFKIHLADSSPVNLVTEKDKEGRVFVSTYPTMMRLIDDAKDGQRRFGVGHFDLVIIDEAHRSVYQKYGAIFDYFDSLLVGLTATPVDEIDRNTYSLFELERGVPTDAYTPSFGRLSSNHRRTAAGIDFGFFAHRRTCWLTLAALRIWSRSAIQACDSVVRRCSTVAIATLRGSLPGNSVNSESFNPSFRIPVRTSSCASARRASFAWALVA